MKLLIVRHADPDYSIDSLTETGWKEAQALSERLCKLDVKDFYCSPLGRARDTASLTLSKLGREATVHPWLREFWPPVRKTGEEKHSIAWDWLPAVWTQEPKFFDYQDWRNADCFLEGNVGQEAQKVFDGMDAILAEHGYVRHGCNYRVEKANEDTLVFFCHFGIECVILSHLLNISPMNLWHNTCAAPSSVTVVITEERRKGIASFRMSAFGDTSHLYAAGMEPSFSARFCETYDNHAQRHD